MGYSLMKYIFNTFLFFNLFNPIQPKPIYGNLSYYLPVQSPASLALPVVVLHGLESSSEAVEPFCKWIETKFNRRVYNIEIGNGEQTSLFIPLTEQLAELCARIYNIHELSNGFNFIGISQGGLLARGYVERCNRYPVMNLITLVAPHGGVFLKTHIDSSLIYTPFIQAHLSMANYWRDPLKLNDYLTECIYLPLLNNEIWQDIQSQQQRANIRSLTNFVMVWSPNDTVLAPPESGKFSFYDAKFKVIPLEETDLYKLDYLGLKKMKERGGLHTFNTSCSHVDHRNPICFAQLYDIFIKFI